MTIGELLVTLGFKADTTKLHDFIHDMGDLNMSSIVAATGLGGVLKSIKDIMDAADNTARSFNNFNSLTGQSRQELQQWEQVAQRSGIAAGVVASTINGLQNSIEDLTLTGAGAGIYGILGIDPRGFKDVFQLASAIGEKIKDYPIAYQKFILKQAGINEQFVMMIPHLNEIKSVGTNSNEQFDSMAKYMRQIVDLSSDWHKLIVSIGSMLENSFVGNMVKGLDVVVKLLNHWQAMVPILALIGVLMARNAYLAIAAGLANPVTAPFAVAAIGALATGAALYGIGAGVKDDNQDNSRQITMHNAITINGDDPHKIGRALDEWHQSKMNEAEGQSYLPNY